MDPVTALGVASAAIQLFQVSVSALQLCREVVNDVSNATQRNRELEESAERTRDLYKDLVRTYSDTAKSGSAFTQIREITEECRKSTKELLVLLESVRGSGKTGVIDKAAAIARAMRRRSKIDDLELKIKEQQRQLNAAIQVELLVEAKSSSLQNVDMIEELRDYQKRFLQELPKGLQQAVDSSNAAYHAETQRILLTAIDTMGARLTEQIIASGQKSTKKSFSYASKTKMLSVIKSKLQPLENVSFNSQRQSDKPRCLKNTCEGALHQIRMWYTKSAPEQCIFWIRGAPGTGKSTIARTIADQLRRKKQLGASFFFSMNYEETRRTGDFFTTLANQLSKYSRDLCEAIYQNIYGQNESWKSSLSEQCRQLLLEPIHSLEEPSIRLPPRTMLVIDALDECDDIEQAPVLIRELLKLGLSSNTRFRILITSRPYGQITKAFKEISRVTFVELDFRPHEDLKTFIAFNLERIRLKRKLGKSWAARRDIAQLVEYTNGRFDAASVICRYISTKPKTHLEQILSIGKSTNRSAASLLDALYTQIMDDALNVYDSETREELRPKMRIILGCLVCSLSDISVTCLSRLASPEPDGAVEAVLDNLGSIIEVPDKANEKIPALHLSFVQYILDPSRSRPEFTVDMTDANEWLARACVRILQNELHYDICDWENSAYLDESTPDAIRDKSISSSLRYAAQFWVKHLSSVSTESQQAIGVCDGGQMHKIFKTKVLYWIEVMAYYKKLAEAIEMLQDFKELLTASDCVELWALADDAERFLILNNATIEGEPLQLYYSALVFSPDESLTKINFRRSLPSWISRLDHERIAWSPRRVTFWTGHVSRARFTEDGDLLVMSNEVVVLWDAKGHQIAKEFISSIEEAKIAPNGRVFAFRLLSGSIIIWNASSGSKTQLAIDGCIFSQFSGDGSILYVLDDYGDVSSHIVREGITKKLHNIQTIRDLGSEADSNISTNSDFLLIWRKSEEILSIEAEKPEGSSDKMYSHHLVVYDLKTENSRPKAELSISYPFYPYRFPLGQYGCADISTNAKLLAVADSGKVNVWKTNDPTKSPPNEPWISLSVASPVHNMFFTTSDEHLGVGTSESFILIDVSASTTVARIDYSGIAFSLCSSQDAILATWALPKEDHVTIWDLASYIRAEKGLEKASQTRRSESSVQETKPRLDQEQTPESENDVDEMVPRRLVRRKTELADHMQDSNSQTSLRLSNVLFTNSARTALMIFRSSEDEQPCMVLKLFHLSEGKIMGEHTIDGHASVESLSNDGFFSVLEDPTGYSILEFKPHGHPSDRWNLTKVTSIEEKGQNAQKPRISPLGKYIATWNENKFSIWDRKSRQCCHSCALRGEVTSITFPEGEDFILLGQRIDSKALLSKWTPSDNTWSQAWQTKLGDITVAKAVISLQASRIIASGWHKYQGRFEISLLDNEGVVHRKLTLTVQRHSNALHYRFSNDDKFLAVVVTQLGNETNEDKIGIWDLKTGKKDFKGKIGKRGQAFTPFLRESERWVPYSGEPEAFKALRNTGLRLRESRDVDSESSSDSDTSSFDLDDSNSDDDDDDTDSPLSSDEDDSDVDLDELADFAEDNENTDDDTDASSDSESAVSATKKAGAWLTWDGTYVLRIPTYMASESVYISGDVVILGTQQGSYVIVRLDTGHLRFEYTDVSDDEEKKEKKKSKTSLVEEDLVLVKPDYYTSKKYGDGDVPFAIEILQEPEPERGPEPDSTAAAGDAGAPDAKDVDAEAKAAAEKRKAAKKKAKKAKKDKDSDEDCKTQ